MATIRFPGVCDFCAKECKPGTADFQSVGSLPPEVKRFHVGHNYQGKWLIRCFSCRNTGNETLKYKQLKEKEELWQKSH